ncbi:hypothetical protein BH09GEM1_BH09GEM1_26450 [soil metagenome]
MTAAGPAVAPLRSAAHPVSVKGRFRFRWSLRLVLLGGVALAFALATLDTYPVGAGNDDAMYLILAKSLATGQGYRSLNVPGAPPNTHFPPGYPAVLSLLWRAAPSFPRNVILFKAFNIVCFVVASIGIARFALRQRLGGAWSIGVGTLAAISVPSLVLVALLFSETFFICLIVWLLPSIEQFVRRRPEARHAIVQAAGIGLAIGLCTLVRSHGFVLVPALVLMLAVQHRWRDIGISVAAFLACLVPWQLWCARYGGTLPTPLLGEYGSYTAWWIRGYREMGPQMVTRTLARTTSEAGSMLAALFSPARGSIPHVATFVSLGILVVAGVAAARRRIPVTLLFLAGYLTIVAIWPFQPARFIWGVWPLLLMVFAFGAHGAADRRWPRTARTVVAMATAWAAVGYASYESRAIRGRWWASIPRTAAPHISFAVEWARSRTAPGDVIATEDEGPVFLYAGRRTVPFRPLTTRQYLEDASPEQDAASGLIPIMAAYPVRSVIVHSSDRYLTAMHLSSLPEPRLAPQASAPGGTAFVVLAP